MVTHQQLNDLLLQLGISTSGLAFGLCIPLLCRLTMKYFKIKEIPHSKILSWSIVGSITVSTVLVVIFREHVTLRRIFLILATSCASLTLFSVRSIGTGRRQERE